MALPVAIQLFGVRCAMEKDPEATLREIGKMGYDGVELYSFAGLSPKDFRKICDEAGLKIMSAHGGYGFVVEQIDKTVEDLKTVGAKYIVLAYINDEFLPGAESHDAFINTMAAAAKRARDAGMQILFHNHDREIGTVNGRFLLDIILDSFGDNLLMPELDVCWVKTAGQDPMKFMKRYTGRCPVVHLKDFYARYCKDGENNERPADLEIRPVGYGRQDMPGILLTSEEIGAEWVVVEQDNPSMGLSELECAALSRDWLKRVGW